MCNRYLCDGVDFRIPGNGGPECLDALAMDRRLVESLLIIVISLAQVFWSLGAIKNKRRKPKSDEAEADSWNLDHSILEKYFSASTIRLVQRVSRSFLSYCCEVKHRRLPECSVSSDF